MVASASYRARHHTSVFCAAYSGAVPPPSTMAAIHSMPPGSEAGHRARETPASHDLLSAGAWPASSSMRVTLEFFQEHAPSQGSVTWVTQAVHGHVHFKPSIRRVSDLACLR